MKRIILSLWGMACVLVSMAQTPQDYIKGRVVDENQEPLFGANLVWEGTAIGTVSDSEGFYQISVPAKYPSHLVISYVGFQSQEIEVNQWGHYHVVLSESVSLEGVDVKAKVKTSELSMINPLNVEKISSAELEKAACCNLAESFETNASIDVSFSDAMTGARQIQMLGLDGVYSQITQENMPLIRGLSSAYGLGFTPGSWIESIQVAKGVGSVVNGFESITGQINLELYKPETAFPLFVNGFVSSEGRLEKNIIISEKKGDWKSATLLHASTTTLEHDADSNGFLDGPTGHQLNAIHRWDYTGNEDFYIAFGLKGMVEDKVAGSDEFQVELGNNILEFFSKTGWKRLAVPGKSMGLQTNFRFHEFESQFGNKNYNATQYSAYLNYIYQSYIGHTDHTYKTGLSYYADAYNKTGSIIDSAFMDMVGGLFWEYSYTGSDVFSAVVGLRADYHDTHGLFNTPRAHLKWNPTDDMVLRLSGGRGFRTAQPLVENIGALASNRTISLPSDLLPEVANNFGGNITQCFYLFGREGSVNADAYYTLFENQMIMDQETEEALSFYNLDGESTSKVLQLDFNYELLDGVDIKASYKTQEVKATFDEEHKFVPFVPKERLMLNVAYKTFFEDWKFDVTLQHIGSSRIPNHADLAGNTQLQFQDGEYWSDPFQKLNAQLTHTLRSVEVYIGGENLLDYKQDTPILNHENPMAADFDASMVWAPTMGRMFYLGFRYKFKK